MTDATTEAWSAHCHPCKRTWDTALPVGVQVDEWSAALAAIACPDCGVVRGYGSARIALDRKGT